MPNPCLPGSHPDPSVVLVDGSYYLVTSTFTFLPGIPVYRSDDLVSWSLIGHVVDRPEQVAISDAPSNAGVWAPTIRYHAGTFYVVVSVVFSPVGCVVFTATDPAGPWSDGTPLQGVHGIDPDLQWDDDGTAYVTFSGLQVSGPRLGEHLGIQQAKVDLATGTLLEEPRDLYSGTGGKFPEAPHLYQYGEHWYLLLAEGGTERGHGVSVARGPSPTGPFTPHPDNPVLTARGTTRPVQNTGHGDLVRTPDGGTALVLLGVRPLGMAYGYSPLGRETFVTEVDWIDDWPVPRPVELGAAPASEELHLTLDDPSVLSHPQWVGVRALPAQVAAVDGHPARLSLTSDGRTLSSPHPAFLGQRQRHHRATVATAVDVSEGRGGLAARYDELHWFALEAHSDGSRTDVIATASLSGLQQTWSASLPAGEVRLRLEFEPRSSWSLEGVGGERILLVASTDAAGDVTLCELDGRYWTAETTGSFTGRVVGLYASEGTVHFADFSYRGSDQLEL